MSMTQRPPPLIAHVVFRFAIGGLENGVVNLINRLPRSGYRHAIVALTDMSNLVGRIERDDVACYSMHKAPGHGYSVYPALYRLFRQLKPAIVHTRNLAALEAAVPAWAAGVPVRIHGEHGRDMHDLDGSVRKYQWLRRLYRPFVTRYVALSRELEGYLRAKVGVPKNRIAQIYNGVDTVRFRPAGGARNAIEGNPFRDGDLWLAGTVGRMQEVKHQVALARAFVRAVETSPEAAQRLRLVMIGDGPLRDQAETVLRQAGVAGLAWLPGERADVAEIMRALDCFVLPSLAEGISNTILEAMASGLPVIATRVGGNAELVDEGRTGFLVSAGDERAMAERMLDYFRDPALAQRHGAAGRGLAEKRFSLDAMVDGYRRMYDESLGIGNSPAHQVDFA